MKRLTNIWLKRAVLVLALPLWVPICIVVGTLLFTAGVLLSVVTLVWCPAVRLWSWVYYGDQYVLGNWWWVIDDPLGHEDRTAAARKRAGLSEDPWMPVEPDSRGSGEHGGDEPPT